MRQLNACGLRLHARENGTDSFSNCLQARRHTIPIKTFKSLEVHLLYQCCSCVEGSFCSLDSLPVSPSSGTEKVPQFAEISGELSGAICLLVLLGSALKLFRTCFDRVRVIFWLWGSLSAPDIHVRTSESLPVISFLIGEC